MKYVYFVSYAHGGSIDMPPNSVTGFGWTVVVLKSQITGAEPLTALSKALEDVVHQPCILNFQLLRVEDEKAEPATS